MYSVCQDLLFILLFQMLATSFGLNRPSSGQIFIKTSMPAANTQYKTGPTYHHRESCDDYLQRIHILYWS